MTEQTITYKSFENQIYRERNKDKYSVGVGIWGGYPIELMQGKSNMTNWSLPPDSVPWLYAEKDGIRITVTDWDYEDGFESVDVSLPLDMMVDRYLEYAENEDVGHLKEHLKAVLLKVQNHE